jgi:hypothetical protein
MPQADEQGVELTGQLESDVEIVARHLGRVLHGVDARIEGVRTDFQVMLLEEVAKLIRRFERLEALIADRFGEELVAELHAALDR